MAKRRPKQQKLPGAEEATSKKVEHAADSYYDCMMARVEASKEETETRDNLIAVMAEEGVDRYEMPDGRIVCILGKKSVKFIKPKGAKKEEE